jgi:hypothetical protein
MDRGVSRGQRGGSPTVVNLSFLDRDNIDTINKNIETVIDGSKEVNLEVNVEKTKYMLVTRMKVKIRTYK